MSSKNVSKFQEKNKKNEKEFEIKKYIMKIKQEKKEQEEKDQAEINFLIEDKEYIEKELKETRDKLLKTIKQLHQQHTLHFLKIEKKKKEINEVEKMNNLLIDELEILLETYQRLIVTMETETSQWNLIRKIFKKNKNKQNLFKIYSQNYSINSTFNNCKNIYNVNNKKINTNIKNNNNFDINKNNNNKNINKNNYNSSLENPQTLHIFLTNQYLDNLFLLKTVKKLKKRCRFNEEVIEEMGELIKNVKEILNNKN